MFPKDSSTVDGLLPGRRHTMYAAKRGATSSVSTSRGCMPRPNNELNCDRNSPIRSGRGPSHCTTNPSTIWRPARSAQRRHCCAGFLNNGTIQSAGPSSLPREYSGQIRAMGRQMIAHLVQDAAEVLPPDLPIAINLAHGTERSHALVVHPSVRSDRLDALTADRGDRTHPA